MTTMTQAVDVVSRVLPPDYFWNTMPSDRENRMVASRRGVMPGFEYVELVRGRDGHIRAAGPGAIGDRRIGYRQSDAAAAVDAARAALAQAAA